MWKSISYGFDSGNDPGSDHNLKISGCKWNAAGGNKPRKKDNDGPKGTALNQPTKLYKAGYRKQ